jgi:hypothetical protein
VDDVGTVLAYGLSTTLRESESNILLVDDVGTVLAYGLSTT